MISHHLAYFVIPRLQECVIFGKIRKVFLTEED